MARARRPPLTHLDTHVVVWLHDGLVERFSPTAVAAIEHGLLCVSGMVELELQYLHEIGRLRPDASEVLTALEHDIGLARSDEPVPAVIAKACTLHWTRDPFDRLISAEALVAGARLVTKDRRILEHCPVAAW